jgi:hypothetical protein
MRLTVVELLEARQVFCEKKQQAILIRAAFAEICGGDGAS